MLIISQLNLLLCLVNDVLDIKMIEQGQFKTKTEAFCIKNILSFTVAMFYPQSKAQSTTVSAQTISTSDFEMLVHHGYENYSENEILPLKEALLPERIVGDHIRLKQILINLVKNALKFTKKGNVKIVAAYDKNTEMLKVHIVDNGKGIKHGDTKKLFKMFGKLKRTADMNSEGLGMGLMICKKLIELNGGSIKVYSNGRDKGSMFSFTMKMKMLS